MLLHGAARNKRPGTDAQTLIQPANPSKHNCFPQYTCPGRNSYFDCGGRSTTKLAIRRLFETISHDSGVNCRLCALPEAEQPLL